MGDWLRSGSEWVSDAIPNEFSKTSNNWTGNIPYVGWVLRGLAGADNAAETYSQSGNLMDAAQHGWTGFSGNAADPNMYSEKNKAGMFGSGDPWLSVGQGVNLVPSQGGSDWMKYGNMASKGIGMMNQGQGQGQSSGGMDMSGIMQMFGGGQKQTQQKSNSKEQFNTMMRSYFEQMLKQQMQPQQQQQQDQFPTQYQPQIEMGNNLYRPEVSGYQGAF